MKLFRCYPKRFYSANLGAQKYDTKFIEPIEDFNFDTEYFAKLSKNLAKKEFINYDMVNEKSIENLIKVAGDQVDNPFLLVENDLSRTKEFAMKNIVSLKFLFILSASNTILLNRRGQFLQFKTQR